MPGKPPGDDDEHDENVGLTERRPPAMPIHPTAIVDPRAEIDASADIGPYVVIDGPVVVGAGTRVLAHAVLTGAHDDRARQRHPHGRRDRSRAAGPQLQGRANGRAHRRSQRRARARRDPPRHRPRASRPRSATTTSSSPAPTSGTTAQLGNRILLANGAALGGHVHVEDQVFVSGNCVVHQYVRIGRLALLRGLSRTSRDVPPFCIMDGTHTVRAINRVGLRRAGFNAAQIRAVQRAFADPVSHPPQPAARPWPRSRPVRSPRRSRTCWRSSAARGGECAWGRAKRAGRNEV